MRLFSLTLPSHVVWNTYRGKNNSPKPSLNTETNTSGFRWCLTGHSVTLTSKLSILLFTCILGTSDHQSYLCFHDVMQLWPLVVALDDYYSITGLPLLREDIYIRRLREMMCSQVSSWRKKKRQEGTRSKTTDLKIWTLTSAAQRLHDVR